ncbi:MAG: 50S ribosomal protein L25 [Patescibacteria group bacterium]
MELNTQNRTVLGKKVKQLRATGFVPGEIFGHGFKNEHVSVAIKEFEKIYKQAGENTVITLVSESGEKTPVLISRVERDLIKNIILSIDFYHVRKDEKIKTRVPIEYIGEDAVIKTGNLLVKVLDEIEVEALPDKIPHSFTIDVSLLMNPGEGISVEDLKVGKEVKILTHKETIIATITEKAKEEVAPTPETTTEEVPETQEKTEEEKE